MKRVLILCLAIAAFGKQPTWITANEFAGQYHDWGALRNQRVEDAARAGTVSLPEFEQWQKVKASWRQLERQVDAEYRGER